MKLLFSIIGVSAMCVTTITGTNAASDRGPLARPAEIRQALAAYELRLLTDPGGHYNARLIQASLVARERLLQTQNAVPAGISLVKGLNRSAAAASVTVNWTEIGPGNIGGRINTIWIDPSNAQHLIVGAAGGGLWQSLDGGQSWAAVAGFPGTLATGALAQIATGTLLAGTGDPYTDVQPGIGMVISADGGQTWTPLSGTVPSSTNPDWYYVNSIAVSSGSVILAATGNTFGGFGYSEGGLWRSTDSGQTWTKVWPTAGGENPSDDVVFDPGNANSAVADTDMGTVVYSTDGGSTWSDATGLPAQTNTGYRVSLAFDSSTSGSVYALVDDAPSGSASGEVFHSTDGGKTWSLLAGTAAFVNQHSGTATGALCDNSEGGTSRCQGDYDNVIAVLSQGSGQPVAIYTGGIDIFKSTDGGNTWSEAGSWLPADSDYLHADQHAFAYDGTDQTFYVGNDGGMFDFPSNATAWTESNSGLAVTQFYRIDGHIGVTASQDAPGGVPITPILAGAQDNGMQLYMGYAPSGAPQPDDWVQFFGGDGVAALVDPADGNDLYGSYVFLGINYSTTGGPTGQYFTTEPPDNTASPQTANFIAPIALMSNGGQATNQMLAGGASLWLGNGIQSGNPSWSSLNGSTLPVGSSGNYISAIGIDPNTNNDIWVGYDDGELWYTTNATNPTGPTWTKTGVGILPANQEVTDIWVVPGQSNAIYVSFAGFTAGGDNIFESTDGGSTWQGIGTSLPPAPVYSLVTDPNYPQILYIGTYTGVYASLDNGQTWTTSNVGPANIAVNQLTWFDTGSRPVLLAATDGRGAWLGSPAYNPTPVLTGISPAQVLVGSAVTITLDGNGFAANAGVDLDGNAVSADVVSSTQIQAALPASEFTAVGTHIFTVVNPIPGGGTSAGATLTVINPQPSATSVSPSSVQAGSNGFTLSVTGSRFVSNSVVQWNGSALNTTFVSPTSLSASVPASDVSAAGSAAVTVSTPAPGGGVSAGVAFTITAPPSKGGGGFGMLSLVALLVIVLIGFSLKRNLNRRAQFKGRRFRLL